MVEHRGGVPARVQVVVGYQERACGRPVLLQEGGEIISIGAAVIRASYTETGAQVTCTLFLYLENLVERLFSGRRKILMTAFHAVRNFTKVSWGGLRVADISFS